MKEKKYRNVMEMRKNVNHQEIIEVNTRTLFKMFNNQITREEAVIIDSKYDCQYVNKSWKIQIHKGINKILNHQLKEFSKHCRLKGGQKFRIVIEEKYNLIILTVFKMIDRWEVLKDPAIEQLGDCSYY
jgi:hypothetical protein